MTTSQCLPNTRQTDQSVRCRIRGKQGRDQGVRSHQARIRRGLPGAQRHDPAKHSRRAATSAPATSTASLMVADEFAASALAPAPTATCQQASRAMGAGEVQSAQRPERDVRRTRSCGSTGARTGGSPDNELLTEGCGVPLWRRAILPAPRSPGFAAPGPSNEPRGDDDLGKVDALAAHRFGEAVVHGVQTNHRRRRSEDRIPGHRRDRKLEWRPLFAKRSFTARCVSDEDIRKCNIKTESRWLFPSLRAPPS